MLVFSSVGIWFTVALYKLFRRLERFHKDKLENMKLPIRVGFLWLVTPIRGVNLLVFLFNQIYFNDDELKRLKRLCRNLYILSFVWFFLGVLLI